MRLTRSKLSSAGIVRKRRGKGFAYYGPDGELLADPDTAQRIKDLVIPPAWKNVWISPSPNGHIQAVGTDVAGRRQYLYHERWQQERAEEKFDRVLELSVRLPEWRAQIAKDLGRRGLERDRVLALALQLLDRGYFRAGGEQSAEEFEHYGLATLLCEHVTLRNGSVVFEYPAKSGVQRNVEIDDPEVVRAVRSLMRTGPGACWYAAEGPTARGSTCAPTISMPGSKSSSVKSSPSRICARGTAQCSPPRRLLTRRSRRRRPVSRRRRRR